MLARLREEHRRRCTGTKRGDASGRLGIRRLTGPASDSRPDHPPPAGRLVEGEPAVSPFRLYPTLGGELFPALPNDKGGITEEDGMLNTTLIDSDN